MLKSVLVILTTTSAGGSHLALSPADDPADCAAKREVVSQILTGAGYTIAGASCALTDLRFTAYDHSAPDSAYVHRWRVQLSEDVPVIHPLTAGEDCKERLDAKQPVYCPLSAQQALP